MQPAVHVVTLDSPNCDPTPCQDIKLDVPDLRGQVQVIRALITVDLLWNPTCCFTGKGEL